MFCRKCGKQIEDDSIFCKYCGSNNLNNIQPGEEEVELNTNINDTSVPSISSKNKNKNTSIKIINFLFYNYGFISDYPFCPIQAILQWSC